MDSNYLYSGVAVCILYLVYRINIRLRLSFAKHPSLRGHAKMSRRLAKQIRYFAFEDNRFFNCDGAPQSIAEARRAGLCQLDKAIQSQTPATYALIDSIASAVSDIEFTSAYRVPFPFRNGLPKTFKYGSVVTASDGLKLKDLDGNWRDDLSGSYGVNVFGYEFYKECLAEGTEKVKALGPVLGPYHPLIQENIVALRKISGLDEISFHMSGTEAVMQAVRLARYHTGKSHLVRFCGAYHGWWDGVQPGVGNQRKIDDVYTLKEMSRATLKVLETRSDIACVLINPLQAFHPNADSASDASLIASTRQTHFDRAAYTQWLKDIREVCSRKNIVLIFDEVFLGFRLAYRGAQEYFGVNADMVTYGKTLGGGLPVGVLCGRHALMKRFKSDSPVNISFARGTFNSHPLVMATMNAFLNRIQQPEYQKLYETIEATWQQRVGLLNEKLGALNLPLKITHMHTILCVIYTLPCRYNWMLQFYLRANGLELAWTGTGRFIMPFSVSDDDFQRVMKKFIRAANDMQRDGWWWQSPQLTNKSIARQMLKEILQARFPLIAKIFARKTNNATLENPLGKAGY